MVFNKAKDTNGVVKSVFIAHFILILHVFLIAALGFLVLFFRGIVLYMPWIFICGSAAILLSGYLVYRRMKKEKKSLQEILSLPIFKDRAVEVNFLGGLASLKVGKSNEIIEIESGAPGPMRQLEDSNAINIDDLVILSRMLENNLITPDEYKKAKQVLFKS